VEEGGPAAGGCGARLAGCCDCRGQPALRPVRDSGQHRFKCAATRGQPIAHSNWRTRIHEAFYEPFGLELTQPLGEDAITDAGYAGKQLIESSRCRDECFHDRPGPALPYQLDSALKGRAVVEAPTDHGERFYALSVFSETTRHFYFFDFLDATLDGLVSDQSSRRHTGQIARARSRRYDGATATRCRRSNRKSQRAWDLWSHC
jgi:hypothetical protein